MATKMYPRSSGGSLNFSLATNTAKANGSTSAWTTWALLDTPGASFVSINVVSVTGPTNGLEFISGPGDPIEWISEPLAADVTISGTVTFNIWASEAAMTVNGGAQVIVERISPTGTLSTIINSEKGTELPTTIAAQNWTGTPTSTAMSRGDRLRIRVLANDAGGTMASGSSCAFDLNGPTGGADGDSWIQFNENLTFESAPAGSTVYLTDTASSVATADVDREAWTSRGSGSVDDVTNTVTGWTAPIQVTDTAGGTAVSWFTKPLTAFTLGGKVAANIRGKESNLAANACLRVEIAVCNGDGSSPTVWASAAALGELTTSDAAQTVYPSGPNTNVLAGQRLRIRLFIDDNSSGATGAPMATGHTVTTTYNGTSAGAAGDTYVTLQQTVTEYADFPTHLYRRRPTTLRRMLNALLTR